jgi:hypothetical protein
MVRASSVSTLVVVAVVCLAAVGAAVILPPNGKEATPVDPTRTETTTPVDAPSLPTSTPERQSADVRTSKPETPTDRPSTVRRTSYLVGRGGTETAVTVVDAERPGPTVVVVGGVHGNEAAGYRAAHRVEDWTVERGTLVVIPEANPRAVANGTRKVDGRDLNAQFPVGERPTSAQARIVWGVVERHNADVVVDLHSSSGVYGVDGGVGQAVFPTVTGPAVEHADAAIERVNGRYELTGNRSFRRGNVMGRSGTTLARKVAGDANETAYIVETTTRDTDLETRVRWTTAVTWELLRLHGLEPERRGGRRPTGPDETVPEA